MERKIYKDLLKWKNDSNRKPLILQGARQVGKTYIVNYFAGKEYANYVYCNFEKDSNLHQFFNQLDPIQIIRKIAIYKRKEIIPNNTLLIFDEIQSCPEAITALKYFNEEANDYHIIALGSLLGVSINRNVFSFPVGKVQIMTMYPLDFEEYLMAKGEYSLIELIKQAYQNDSQLDNAFHEVAIDYYKEYLFVGGMPEIVEEYNKNHNPELARILQANIIESYLNDMGKYNKQTEVPKTKIVYKSISSQLSRENKKFQYKNIKHGARAKEYEEAIEWLCLSGIASQLYKVESIKLPLNAYKSLNDFKFYMSDVGLCGAMQNIYYEDIYGENVLFDNFKGGLVENYVYNHLIVNKHQPYYWNSEYTSEVDFIVRIKEDIIPIEVKSSINVRSKSLNVYMEKYSPKYSIRISLRNFGFENNIKSIPLYAVFCIK